MPIIHRRTYQLNVIMKAIAAPADATEYYFSDDVNTPTSTATDNEISVPKTGIINCINLLVFSQTVSGTAEAWSMYLRNNTTTTDYLIATVSVAAAKRVWNNENLNIPVTKGDLICIKTTTPNWVTNPQGSIMSGYILVTVP